MARSTLVIATLTFVLTACSSSRRGGGEGEGPIILSFTSNIGLMLEQDELVLSAVVTDPGGIDDLIGGILVHPGGGTYGAFATAAEEGAYEMRLGWSQINEVAPIVSDPGGVTRTFRAQFFDIAGHTAQQDLDVTLGCVLADAAICDGDCVNLSSDPDHCGACGDAVPEGLSCLEGHDVCHDEAWDIYSLYCDGECQFSEEDCGECGRSCADLADAVGADEYRCDVDALHCVVEIEEFGRRPCTDVCSAAGLACRAATAYHCREDYSCDNTPIACDVVPAEVWPCTFGGDCTLWSISCFCRE